MFGCYHDDLLETKNTFNFKILIQRAKMLSPPSQSTYIRGDILDMWYNCKNTFAHIVDWKRLIDAWGFHLQSSFTRLNEIIVFFLLIGVIFVSYNYTCKITLIKRKKSPFWELNSPLYVNSKSPSNKDVLYKVCLKLALWLWWRNRKCETFRDGQTDIQTDEWQAIKKADELWAQVR